MDIKEIIGGLDKLFEDNKLDEIEGYLSENMVKAMQELQLLHLNRPMH